MNEYGVVYDRFPDDLHRGPMTAEEAAEWIREWEEEVAPQARKGMFRIVVRTVSDWKPWP